jgi:hypothetical protein
MPEMVLFNLPIVRRMSTTLAVPDDTPRFPILSPVRAMISSPGRFCLYSANHLKTEFSSDIVQTCTGGINPFMDCNTLMILILYLWQFGRLLPWHQRIVY